MGQWRRRGNQGRAIAVKRADSGLRFHPSQRTAGQPNLASSRRKYRDWHHPHGIVLEFDLPAGDLHTFHADQRYPGAHQSAVLGIDERCIQHPRSSASPAMTAAARHSGASSIPPRPIRLHRVAPSYAAVCHHHSLLHRSTPPGPPANGRSRDECSGTTRSADSHDDIRGDRDGQRISGLREIDRVLTDRAALPNDVKSQPVTRWNRRRGADLRKRQRGQAGKQRSATDHVGFARTYRPTLMVPARKPPSQ